MVLNVAVCGRGATAMFCSTTYCSCLSLVSIRSRHCRTFLVLEEHWLVLGVRRVSLGMLHHGGRGKLMMLMAVSATFTCSTALVLMMLARIVRYEAC